MAPQACNSREHAWIKTYITLSRLYRPDKSIIVEKSKRKTFYLSLPLCFWRLCLTLCLLFSVFISAGSLCMTTRLFVGSIQRAVTVDTHCWMWALHFFHTVQPSYLHSMWCKVGTTYYVLLVSDQCRFSLFFFSSSLTLLSSQPWSGSWPSLSCKSPVCARVSCICL